MQKLKTFFLTFFRSLTDPAYYNDVIKARVKFSLKYFLTFYVSLSLIIVATISFTVLPTLPSSIDQGLDQALSLYPNGLEVTLDTNKAEIAVAGAAEPVIFPFPSNEYLTANLKNLLVIDTSASISAFTNYQTAILLTRTELITLANEGSAGYQVMPMKDIVKGFSSQEAGRSITSLTLKKSLLESNLPLLKSFVHRAIQFAPLILFPLITLSFIVSRLLILAFLTLFTSALSFIMGKNLIYKKLFQIGLHTLTVTDTIIELQQLVFPDPIPMLFTIAFIGITFIAILGINSPKKAS